MPSKRALYKERDMDGKSRQAGAVLEVVRQKLRIEKGKQIHRKRG